MEIVLISTESDFIEFTDSLESLFTDIIKQLLMCSNIYCTNKSHVQEQLSIQSGW